MSLFERFRSNRQEAVAFSRPATAAPATPPPGDPVTVRAYLEAAQRRTVAAEDATRKMSARLASAKADRASAVANATQLRSQVRDLDAEVTTLRRLLADEKAKRGADRRCATCHEPMPWGTSHFCSRRSEYIEEKAA